MTKKELLDAYRKMVIDLEELKQQMARIGSTGQPSDIRGYRTDGVHRGTNHPEAASLQLVDGLAALQAHREAELAVLGQQVGMLLGEIRDARVFMVIQHYYVFAQTEEQVARALMMSRSRVNQLRTRYLAEA